MGSDTETPRPKWLLLAFHLPAGEGYPRVKVWRRLQGVGAVSFRNSLYVLPANDQTQEDFEWILREICSARGDGAVFEAELCGGSDDRMIRNLFNAAREGDYLALAEELRTAVAARSSTTGEPGKPGDQAMLATRARRRLREIEAIDFFGANGRDTVHALLQKLEAEPRAAAGKSMQPDPTEPAALRGRTWVTRTGVRVDRMASAWLIRRWIDPEARFRFVNARDYQPRRCELRFDMYEAEYTHDADRCTFEVLLDLVLLRDEGLVAIGEIVHDLDIKDGKYDRPEAAGVRQLLEGIIAGTADDEERLTRSASLFEDLHRSFSMAAR